MSNMKWIVLSMAGLVLLTGIAADAMADAESIIRIRKRPDLLIQEWDELIDDALEVSNPLYEQDVNEGVNPLYEPKSMVFNPGDFFNGTPVRFELQMEPELPDGVYLPPDSYAFDIKLFEIDPNGGHDRQVFFFSEPLTFSFDIPGLSDGDIDDLVLGYLDETKSPPEWKVEDSGVDKCLDSDRDNLFCGTTDHLTTFILAPSTVIPEPTSLLLFGLGGLAMMRRKRTVV